MSSCREGQSSEVMMVIILATKPSLGGCMSENVALWHGNARAYQPHSRQLHHGKSRRKNLLHNCHKQFRILVFFWTDEPYPLIEPYFELQFSLTELSGTNTVLPAGLSKKKHEKKMPLSEKKNTISAKKKKKKHFLALYLFLKGYFVYLFYTKYPLSTCFKLLTTYSYSLIFQKPPYFTKQQTPLMIIISHNFKEMIFFIRID